jgi:putative addiction module component (TIGR02574 family)
MASNVHDLGIDSWSVADRLRLIGEIWDTLDDESQFEIPESHRKELERRIADYETDPAGGSTLQEVMDRLRQEK